MAELTRSPQTPQDGKLQQDACPERHGRVPRNKPTRTRGECGEPVRPGQSTHNNEHDRQEEDQRGRAVDREFDVLPPHGLDRALRAVSYALQNLADREVVGELGKDVQKEQPRLRQAVKAPTNPVNQARLMRVDGIERPGETAVILTARAFPNQVAVRLDGAKDHSCNRTDRDTVAYSEPLELGQDLFRTPNPAGAADIFKDVVPIETGATVAHLQEPGPDLGRGCVDGYRARRQKSRRRIEIVAGHCAVQLLLGRAPMKHIGTRDKHVGEQHQRDETRGSGKAIEK